jgi:exopolysaccharide biosynthesis polyprenyl glycosylphosphotransferase
MFERELRKQKILFVAADCVALAAAFVGALWLHDPSGIMEARLLNTDILPLSAALIGVAALWLVIFAVSDLYRIRNGGLKEVRVIVKGCSIAALLTLLVAFLAHVALARLTVVLAYLLSMPLVWSARAVARASIRRVYANPDIAVPVVVAGFNPVGHYLFDRMLDEMTHYKAVGFVDDLVRNGQYRGYPTLGNPEQLAEMAALYPRLEVAIAMPDATPARLDEIIAFCEQHRIKWSIVPWLYHSVPAGLRVDMAGSLPLIRPRGSNVQGLNFALKRIFDMAIATSLLIVLAPIIGFGALAVWLFDGRPMFIRQTRVGIHGNRFQLLKLRTMRVNCSDTVHRDYAKEWISNGHAAARQANNGGARVFKLADDNRVTRVGRFLRRFSIDELPQLANVVRGEMSLIGPRPALPYELDFYQMWHRRRLEVVPGITGLWQVTGRNRLSFDEMVRLDVRYLEEWSLTKDLGILARTIPIVFRGNGV